MMTGDIQESAILFDVLAALSMENSLLREALCCSIERTSALSDYYKDSREFEVARAIANLAATMQAELDVIRTEKF